MWIQIIIGLVLGIALGQLLSMASDIEKVYGLNGVHSLIADIGRIGMLPIRALKMLAVPLVAFVILDALLRFDIEGRQGVRLVRICAMNVMSPLAAARSFWKPNRAPPTSPSNRRPRSSVRATEADPPR